MKQPFNTAIKGLLDEKLKNLEEHFKADVIFLSGPIDPSIARSFRDFIEDLKEGNPKKDILTFFLKTGGGHVETVEKMVRIIRKHYKEVYFIVPDYAMSAGTILCMSGDRIYMDYSSALGPIDPQVHNGKEWVPALGYIDKVEQLIEKSRKNTITPAEIIMLRSQDLAMLRSCEQARDLTIDLLKRWLVKYKFKNWDKHNSNPSKKDQTVTIEEKKDRAEDIAKDLGNNGRWCSHGRAINAEILHNEINLKIEDYSDNIELRKLIRDYNDLICDYVQQRGLPAFAHSRKFF